MRDYCITRDAAGVLALRPVFPEQAFDTGKLPIVRRNQRVSARQSLSCDQRVIRANGLLLGFKNGTQLPSPSSVFMRQINRFNPQAEQTLNPT